MIASLQEPLILFDDALLRDVLVLDNDNMEAEGASPASHTF